MNYIDIEKGLIPYRFDLSLTGTVYTFEVHYNAEHDFYSVNLELGGQLLAAGEKLVYGRELFTEIADSRFPLVSIIPFDLTGTADSVTFATLGVNVFLYLDGDSQ
jgi:hypothetical protein